MGPPGLVGYPAAGQYLGFGGNPSTIYVRAQTGQVNAVYNLLADQANPENPDEVQVSQPSSALTARADAQGAFNGLFLGLGAVALLVGAVGVANIMVISVLERRSEIGLRRGRHRRRCARDRDLRLRQGLGDRDPHARVGGRLRRGAPDRRARRPAP